MVSLADIAHLANGGLDASENMTALKNQRRGIWKKQWVRERVHAWLLHEYKSGRFGLKRS